MAASFKLDFLLKLKEFCHRVLLSKSYKCILFRAFFYLNEWVFLESNVLNDPGDRIVFCFDEIFIFIFKTFSICFGVIIPGLKIHILPTKFKTVDSIPILETPPSSIFTLLLNSSKTSKGFTELTPDDIFALGMARGKSSFFNNSLIILFFGNLMPTVFKFAQALGFILELVFLTYAIGPGLNFL